MDLHFFNVWAIFSPKFSFLYYVGIKNRPFYKETKNVIFSNFLEAGNILCTGVEDDLLVKCVLETGASEIPVNVSSVWFVFLSQNVFLLDSPSPTLISLAAIFNYYYTPWINIFTGPSNSLLFSTSLYLNIQKVGKNKYPFPYILSPSNLQRMTKNSFALPFFDFSFQWGENCLVPEDNRRVFLYKKLNESTDKVSELILISRISSREISNRLLYLKVDLWII